MTESKTVELMYATPTRSVFWTLYWYQVALLSVLVAMVGGCMAYVAPRVLADLHADLSPMTWALICLSNYFRSGFRLLALLVPFVVALPLAWAFCGADHPAILRRIKEQIAWGFIVALFLLLIGLAVIVLFVPLYDALDVLRRNANR